VWMAIALVHGLVPSGLPAGGSTASNESGRTTTPAREREPVGA